MDKINQKLCKNEKENCMKKTNNQGFSLVELIIVIAIMAVLIGVLAPQFLKYVERSRVQKDESAIEEVRNATEIALANENIYQEVATLITGTVTAVDVVISPTGVLSTLPAAGTTDLLAELNDVLGTIDLSSSQYSNATTGGATIRITINSTTGTVSVVTQ